MLVRGRLAVDPTRGPTVEDAAVCPRLATCRSRRAEIQVKMFDCGE
jgi:hypothetical protein